LLQMRFESKFCMNGSSVIDVVVQKQKQKQKQYRSRAGVFPSGLRMKIIDLGMQQSPVN